MVGAGVMLAWVELLGRGDWSKDGEKLLAVPLVVVGGFPCLTLVRAWEIDAGTSNPPPTDHPWTLSGGGDNYVGCFQLWGFIDCWSLARWRLCTAHGGQI